MARYSLLPARLAFLDGLTFIDKKTLRSNRAIKARLQLKEALLAELKEAVATKAELKAPKAKLMRELRETLGG